MNAAYRLARAELAARLATAPPPTPQGLDALAERRPELVAAAEVVAAAWPGVRVSDERSEG